MLNLSNSDRSVHEPHSGQQPDFVVSGVLGRGSDAGYIQTDDGRRITMSEPIWSGYLTHWLGRRVKVYRLPQRDYYSGAQILLLAPDEPAPEYPYVDLYYNECLRGYLSSLFGHLAINVDGKVFSFSETLNENEEMTPEEFFYRPALGEFSGHPDTRVFDVSDPERPYYDKFGRRFMRTIHAIRIKGLDTVRLIEILQTEVRVIHETPLDPHRPYKYRDFHSIHRSCTSILRDALREAGLREVSGVIPRELFLSVAYQATRLNRSNLLSVCAIRLEQLKVPERSYSRPSPILNPLNHLRLLQLRRIPGASEILPW
jgi:hypothetical protein